MPRFKKDDRVTVVDQGPCRLKKGQTSTVIKLLNGSTHQEIMLAGDPDHFYLASQLIFTNGLTRLSGVLDAETTD